MSYYYAVHALVSSEKCLKMSGTFIEKIYYDIKCRYAFMAFNNQRISSTHIFRFKNDRCH